MSMAPRRFTGWHMTAILVGFFAVVIAVNMLMATVAVRSFGGTVVDNSYVASQQFNNWLAKARAAKQSGWQATLTLGPARNPHLLLQGSDGTPLAHADITGIAAHPLGRAPDIILDFQQQPGGYYRARQALPRGRWIIRYSVTASGKTQQFMQEIR